MKTFSNRIPTRLGTETLHPVSPALTKEAE